MQVKNQQSESNMEQWTNRERIRSRLFIIPCLFNLYAEYIMRNARLDEAQAGTKIARKNTNNLIYTDDTTLKAES